MRVPDIQSELRELIPQFSGEFFIFHRVAEEELHDFILTPPVCLKSVTLPTLMARTRANEFEKAFQQLEKIVQRLEAEELPLDESLQLFEEGIRLSRFCNQKLEEVEKKIELILADAKGQPRVEPFEEAELDAEGVEEEP